ncbi:MAG: hypothetical protein J5I50_07710 [Chitinophagaceae bacterium]|nr:hypothetical protein [Chitinophagaceae bacterium]
MKKQVLLIFSLIFVSNIFAQRDTIEFNDNWQFAIYDDGVKINTNEDLPGSRIVTLPHTWNVEDKYQNHYGWGWYQKSFTVPAAWKNKNVVLEFGAINHTSIFTLNGNKIMTHSGDGFNKIIIPLNGLLKYGKENILRVLVNNAYSNNKVPFGSSFDWPNDGGIIRPAQIIVSDKPAAAYIHATPTVVNDYKDGKLHLKLGFDKPVNISWTVTITEENQATKNVVYNETIQPVWTGNAAEADISLPNIHLWHFDFPNLYKVDVTIHSGKKTTDKISTVVGFKDLKLQNGKVYLNGENIKLMGVEWTAGSNPDYGFAESDSLIRAIGKLMKDVNCIFSRQHFQQGDVFYDFCDRNGILVQQEVPLWGGETPANDTIRKIAMRQLQTMINNLYNHTSIFAWGVGNELRARDADMKELIGDLLVQSRKLDPSRYTGYCSNTLTWGFYNSPNFVADAGGDGDFLMMNEYGGSWWQLPTGKIGAYLDSIHMTYPNIPFFISEFGICEPNFKGGDQRRLEDMIYHIATYESRPYIEGAIYFDLTDYRTHYPGTQDDDKYRQRVHGIYDVYGNPKPSMKVLREYSSPIEVQTLSSWKKGKLTVTAFGNIGLPQHTIKGYKLYLSDREDNWQGTKAYEIPETKPGEKVLIEIDDLYNGGGIITVVRPTGYVVSQKSFNWKPEDM